MCVGGVVRNSGSWPTPKKAQMGKTKNVTAFGDVRIQTGSWQSRLHAHTHTHTHTVPGVSSQQSTLNCKKAEPYDNSMSAAQSLCLCVSTNAALECAIILARLKSVWVCVCVRICMQSCVKCAC